MGPRSIDGSAGATVFTPFSVAVIGATETRGKVGRLLMENLRGSFQGEVYPVHPQAREVFGFRAHRTVRELTGRVQLAVVATRPEIAVEVVEDCAQAGVATVVVIGGGFSEASEAGAVIETNICAIAERAGMRLIGPNCFGVIDVGSGFNASLAAGLPSPGTVSLVTQSGAYAMAAVSRSREGQIGIRRILSLGNKADVDEVDAVKWLADDPETKVIALLLESTARGRCLAGEIAATSKPVVVFKTGRGNAGRRAAASHTSALANDGRVVEAALRQAGAHWVRDGLGLLDTAAALAMQPRTCGQRVAVVTNSGGVGVELADLLEGEGLEVPELSDGIRQRIERSLPHAGNSANPIDVTTDWPNFPESYGNTLRLLLRSDEVDMVLVTLVHRAALDLTLAERIIAETAHARSEGSETPIHVCAIAPPSADPIRRRLIAAGIPFHPWPLRAARAVAAMRTPEQAGPVARFRPARAAVPAPESTGWMAPDVLNEELATAGLPVSDARIAASAGAAADAAAQLGFPVVLKALRTGLIHRSRADAVRLGLYDTGAVSAAFEEFSQRLGAGPALVQAQAECGVEFMVGSKRDAAFGPVLIVGLGGIWVETLDDIALRVAPVEKDAAADMLDALRNQQMLDAPMGCPPVDRHSLARFIAQVSAWVQARPWISELDLNPVLVRGNSITIVDARLRVDEPLVTRTPRNES